MWLQLIQTKTIYSHIDFSPPSSPLAIFQANLWFSMAASGSCPPASVGVPSRPPPSPPDPTLPSPPAAPPLPSPSPSPFTVLSVRSDLPFTGVQTQPPTSVSAAELLTYYLISPKSVTPNPNLDFSPILPSPNPSLKLSNPPLLVNPSASSLNPSPVLPSPPPSASHPPPAQSTVPTHQSWAEKTKISTDKTLKSMSSSSTSISPDGVPRVTIPDEVFQRGALLHKDFIVGRFFGRVPSFKTIQNVLNYLWGKGNKLEIHMIASTRSMIVRIPSDFVRDKVLKKRIWYVDTAMFHVAQWSDGEVANASSLESIQLWAHLKGVPFDLMTNEGLSWITDAIGIPIEMDDWTKNLSSLSVAHVKVEANATKPFPTVLELVRQSGATFRVEVEYPWLPPTCSHCKELGHIIKDCLQIKRQWVPVQRQNDPAKDLEPSLPVSATVFEPSSTVVEPPSSVPPCPVPDSPPSLPPSPLPEPYQVISLVSDPSTLPLPEVSFSEPASLPDLSSFPPLASSLPPLSPPLNCPSPAFSPPSPASPASPCPQNYVLALAATVMPKSSIPAPLKPLSPPLLPIPPACVSPTFAASYPLLPSSQPNSLLPSPSPTLYWESPKRKTKLTHKPATPQTASQSNFSNPFAPLSNLTLPDASVPSTSPPLPPLPPPHPPNPGPMVNSSPDVGTLLSQGVPPSPF